MQVKIGIGIFAGFVIYFASEYPIDALLKLIPNLVTTNLSGTPQLTTLANTISIILQAISAVSAGIWIANRLK